MRKKHPDKNVEDALRYAEENGWQIKKGGHWGFLYCPYNDPGCRQATRCKAGIWGTPKNAFAHAQQLRAVINNCSIHQKVDRKFEKNRKKISDE